MKESNIAWLADVIVCFSLRNDHKFGMICLNEVDYLNWCIFLNITHLDFK